MATVVAIAYGTSAPSMAVAEFAPTARQSLDAPPATAGDQTGKAASGRSRRATTTSAPPAATTSVDSDSGSTAPTTRVGRARECYGNPPRQAEDLLAPACMATVFEGDNGGATARGVTNTEIRVAVPVTDANLAAAGSKDSRRQAIDAFFDYMNRRFEFYGRRLVPFYVAGSASDAVTSRSLGAQVATNDVFAAITGPLEQMAGSPQPGVVQEMARVGIVTVTLNRGAWWSDRTLFDAFHPYLWSVYPSSEQIQRQVASVACGLGPNAAFAPDPDFAGKPRRFGVIAAGRQSPPNVAVVSNGLEACTGRAPEKFEWTQLSGSSGVATGINRLNAAGVTTVICICENYAHTDIMFPALSQGFDPEWIFPTTGYWGSDEYLMQQVVGNGVARGSVQVQSGPRMLPLQARPWFQALLAANPALVSSDKATLSNAFQYGESTYTQLLLLASGIQSAGPTLSADTFAAGLMTTQFPNPGAGQAPAWQPSVGFGPGDHGFYNDFAVAWWSMTEPAIEPTGRPVGSWCYVNRGDRYRPETLPPDIAQHLYNANEPCR